MTQSGSQFIVNGNVGQVYEGHGVDSLTEVRHLELWSVLSLALRFQPWDLRNLVARYNGSR